MAYFEVRTVGVDELSEEDGIMRSLNGVDKSAAEDRFCWPPPTPSCVSSTDTRGPRVRFLERGNGFQLSNLNLCLAKDILFIGPLFNS